MHHHPPPPNPNPPPVLETFSHHVYSTHQSSHYTHQNPIPNPSPYPPVAPPSLHEPHFTDPINLRPVQNLSYASVSSLIDRYGGAHQAYAPPQVAGPMAAPYVYYQDQGVVNAGHNWSTGVAIQQHGLEQFVPQIMNAQVGTNATVHSKNGGKKTKIVQSVWCDLCKIDCNSKDMLDIHKSGKKHQKNLEKLKQASNPQPTAPEVVSSNPIIGPPENPKNSKSEKKNAEPLEGPEKKKRKIGEVGIRRCDLCNVLCNSDKVFQTHLAGKKHTAAMAKNHAK